MLVVKKKNTSYKKPYLFNCQQLDEKLLEQKRFASERSKDEAKDLKFNFPQNKTPGFHELPTIADPESPFPPFGSGLFAVVKGTKDSVCSTVTYPFPLLPQLWYEKTGINAEHERKRKDIMTTLKITQSPSTPTTASRDFLENSKPTRFLHELPTMGDNLNPESPFPPFGSGLFSVVKGTKDSVCSTVTYPFPLLPQLWYEKTGINAEHERKRKDNMTTLKITQSPSTPTTASGDFLENNKPTRFFHSSTFQEKRPFPLMNKKWYQRRGRLAAKNIAREKENLHKQRPTIGNHGGSIENNFCTGTLTESIRSARATLAKTYNKIKAADLNGVIKTAQFIESDGPIVSTQEAAKIFYCEKERCLGISTGGKKTTRIKSSEFFQKLSRHLNIKQIYIYGKAFLIENRSQNVHNVINRISTITNTEKVVNDKIMTAIGDIFKESINYVDTKRDRDVLKALFAQATSASFVAKLQGVSNKSSIMNATDELRGNINSYRDIISSSQIVRNDMTSEQQHRLTKRIIQKRKQTEIKLPDKYDARGRMLKVEQFPEMCRIMEGIFDGGSMDECTGGGLESHPRLITSTRYKSMDNVIFMRQARNILLTCAPPNFTISLSSCYNYTENYRENSMQAKQHHAGRDINANISFRRPSRSAVIDNKQVVNLHWSTCSVNHRIDKAASEPNAFMVDSKDAKSIVLADSCPVQKTEFTRSRLGPEQNKRSNPNVTPIFRDQCHT